MAIRADDKFVEAFEEVTDWLQPIENPTIVIHKFKKSKIYERYPKESLSLLCKILDNSTSQHYFGLRDVLNELVKTSPKLCQDHKFKILDELT